MKEREYFVNEFQEKNKKILKETTEMLDALNSVKIVKNKAGQYYKALSRNIIYSRKYNIPSYEAADRTIFKAQTELECCKIEKNEYSNIDSYYFHFYSCQYENRNYIYFSIFKNATIELIISKFNEELEQEKNRLKKIIENCNYCITNADELINEVLDAQSALNEKLKKISSKCDILREAYFNLSFI